jgi:hypothetical protein
VRAGTCERGLEVARFERYLAGTQQEVIAMTKMFDEAIKKVRELPDTIQDEAAEILFSVAARQGEPVRLDDETRAAALEGRAQARRGEFGSDSDIAAFFARHGVKR